MPRPDAKDFKKSFAPKPPDAGDPEKPPSDEIGSETFFQLVFGILLPADPKKEELAINSILNGRKYLL
jgi:hypothetical protein